MMFRIGQKVVCIKAQPFRTVGRMFGDEVLPQYKEVYTVRTIEVDYGHSWIRLYEIVNPIHDYGNSIAEASFRSDRFRAVVTRKTDISAFTKCPTDKLTDA